MLLQTTQVLRQNKNYSFLPLCLLLLQHFVLPFPYFLLYVLILLLLPHILAVIGLQLLFLPFLLPVPLHHPEAINSDFLD
jgi:hypothetical protein